MSGLPASVLLVGCGRMGGALVAGWGGSLPVSVIDPNAPAELDVPRLLGAADLETLPRPCVVILAVKPALIDGVVREFAAYADQETLFVSVAAGVKIEAIERAADKPVPVARAMPNIAAAMRAGATALAFGRHATDADSAMVAAVFERVGEVVLLEDEALIDVATAISGSGPAYFFRFAEALAKAGAAAGLRAEDAVKLAKATLRGAGALCVPEADVVDLRSAVTSPAGTTAAAVAALEQDERIDRLAEDAVAAAVRRAGELSR